MPISYKDLTDRQALVLFDGVCNSCNFVVNLLLRLDRHEVFYFLPLQSSAAKRILQSFHLPAEPLDTLVVISQGQAHTFSGAVFEICRRLGWPWKGLLIFSFLPRSLNDFIYLTYARSRYRFFGRREVCRIPTEVERRRFIDEE